MSTIRPTITMTAVLVVALAVAFAFPTAARAEGENAEALAKITKLNKRALDEYDNLNFEESRKLLKDALDLCAQSGLDKHPIAARTYAHLGVVTLAGFKQRDAAVKYFRKALEIDPAIKLQKALANPEVQDAFDEAARSGGGAPGGAEPAEGASAPEGLSHEPVTNARQGATIPISATVEAALGADKVVLAYRADGADEFTSRAMSEESPGNFAANIPASATAGGVVAYYVEARKDDEVVASRGSKAEPIIVTLAPSPASRRSPRPSITRPRQPSEKEGASKLYLGLGVGSGVGWTTGSGDVNPSHKVSPSGLAFAQLGHIAPELGYFIRPGLMLSVLGRIQIVSGPVAENCAGCSSPPSYAFAGFVKATWMLGEGQLQPYVSVAAGGGTIRHVTEFKTSDPNSKDCAAQPDMTCVESISAGAVLLGPGAGVIYKMTPSFGLNVALNTQLGFPDFTFNADLNLGVALSF